MSSLHNIKQSGGFKRDPLLNWKTARHHLVQTPAQKTFVIMIITGILDYLIAIFFAAAESFFE
jgi:hypothetical protein